MRMYHEENSVNRHEDDIYHVGKELRAWCYYWYVATSGELQTKPRYYSRLQCSKTPNVLMMSCYLCEISTAIPSESHPWAYIKWICQNEIGSIERAQELSCEWQKLFEWVLKLAWCYLDTRRINAALLVLLPICVVQQSMQVAMDD